MDNQDKNIKIRDKREKVSDAKFKKNTKYNQNSLVIENPLPLECESFFQEMVELNQSELKSALVDKSLVIGANCHIALKKYLQQKGLDFNCNEINPICLSQLTFVKAFKVAETLSQLDANSLSDSELAAKIVSLFFNFKDEISKDQLEQNLSYFKEFYERFRTDNRVIELYVGYLLISSQIQNDNKFNELINELLENNGNENFKLDRLKVVQHAMNKNDALAAKSLQDLQARYP